MNDASETLTGGLPPVKHGRGGKIINRIGIRYGKLVVKSFAGFNASRQTLWLCQCDCGKQKVVIGSRLSLVKEPTKSCGCLFDHSWNITHGRSKTVEYRAYWSMKYRCYYKKSKKFKNYGGRGITVCDRWLNSFENFLADMGERPKGTSLDRINNDGNYEPSNCRWATPKVQCYNKRTTYFLEFNGEKLTRPQWSSRTGLSVEVIRGRIRRGWSVEKTITTPYKKRV